MKRMRKMVSLKAAALVAAFVMASLTGSAADLNAQSKTIVWNIPHTAAPTYFHILNLKAFAEKVGELSKGRMEIRVHPASSLFPQQEQIPAVVEGRVEIAPILTSYMVDLFLPMGVLELPFMTSSLDEHQAAMEKLKPFYIEQLAKRISSSWPSGPGPLSSSSRPKNPSRNWRISKA